MTWHYHTKPLLRPNLWPDHPFFASNQRVLQWKDPAEFITPHEDVVLLRYALCGHHSPPHTVSSLLSQSHEGSLAEKPAFSSGQVHSIYWAHCPERCSGTDILTTSQGRTAMIQDREKSEASEAGRWRGPKASVMKYNWGDLLCNIRHNVNMQFKKL